MTTNINIKTIASIFPECNTEMAYVEYSMNDYSRAFERLTNRQLTNPTPEYISDSATGELNMAVNRVEDAINSLCKCRNTNIQNK